jgi:hypothetical protein
MATASVVRPATIREQHHERADTDRAISAKMMQNSAILLAIAPTITVAVYLFPAERLPDWWANWVNVIAPLTGIGATVAAALAYTFFACKPTAEKVDSLSFSHIHARLEALEARLNVLCPAGGVGPTSGQDMATTCSVACEEARAHLDAIGHNLRSAGAKWVLGTGYLDLWGQMHALEEALLLVSPDEEIVATALSDEMRLKGSAIVNSDDFLAKLRWATCALGGRQYLTPAPPPPVVDENWTPTAEERAHARLVVRDVHRAINEFRDNGLDGLIRARNSLIWTGTLTMLTIFALLALAILANVGPAAVSAGVTFYLVGALIGLFSQLRTDSGLDARFEGDFSLARARLFYVPVLSGIAAVGGVVLTTMLYASLTGTTLTSNDVPEGAIFPPLQDIFNLRVEQAGIVIAAIFGLTPGLLVDRLQDQANRYLKDLQSTEAHAH